MSKSEMIVSVNPFDPSITEVTFNVNIFNMDWSNCMMMEAISLRILDMIREDLYHYAKDKGYMK